MCRFLMVKSEKEIKPAKLLREFSSMCRQSRTLDGDWQGDGWGVAAKLSAKDTSEVAEWTPPRWKKKRKEWFVYKSLKPIWQEQNKFNRFPQTKLLVVHARSASFASQKGILEYNQPYIKNGCCFVFNGLLERVRIKSEGKIGAQKIFHLLLNYLQLTPPLDSLKKLRKVLLKNSKTVKGLNIGLVYKDKFYVLCQQLNNADYFAIRYNKKSNLVIVASDSFGTHPFKKMRKGEIKCFG